MKQKRILLVAQTCKAGQWSTTHVLGEIVNDPENPDQIAILRDQCEILSGTDLIIRPVLVSED